MTGANDRWDTILHKVQYQACSDPCVKSLQYPVSCARLVATKKEEVDGGQIPQDEQIPSIPRAHLLPELDPSPRLILYRQRLPLYKNTQNME